MAKLTKKQAAFCEEYIIDLNATQAAIRAGYSENTAGAIGHENLRKPKIKKHIDKLLEQIQSERIADATEVMEYLTSVMRRECGEHAVVTLREKESKWVPDDEGVKRKQTTEREIPKVVEFPTKVSDANKAAELLGRRYAMFTDNVSVEGEIPVVISGEDELEDT